MSPLADEISGEAHYFTLSGRAPFQHLDYPMPDHAGPGIHVTLDLGGQCKFGPDVSGWPASPDYSFEAGLEDKFYRAIRPTTLTFQTALSNQATPESGPK
jgi:L-2-hydroxyglutarate oxidase LhgO